LSRQKARIEPLSLSYPLAMVFPSSFVEPCVPSKAAAPPSGALWVHEIKHDGYRLMVRRDGQRVRCFTRNGPRHLQIIWAPAK
jgi:ATP-dependent DNA ligase